jgi:hypothetical protein
MKAEWQPCDMKVFWGEIAPCNHLLQVYENDEGFLDVLEGFVSSGIDKGDCVIIIATASHVRALEKQLTLNGYNIEALIKADQYIPLNAEETLSKFMVTGWPDEKLFMQFVSDLIARARKNGREVRAFGEMVAILWEQGYNGATVQLEHMWNKFCETEAFCLFCAYPQSGFTGDANDSLSYICSAHSKMIQGSMRPRTEILYRTLA